jgi:hypothetical protein
MPNAPHPDTLLVEAIRAGKPDAWNTLIAQYEGRLLSFVDSRLRRRASGEQQAHGDADLPGDVSRTHSHRTLPALKSTVFGLARFVFFVYRGRDESGIGGMSYAGKPARAARSFLLGYVRGAAVD